MVENSATYFLDSQTTAREFTPRCQATVAVSQSSISRSQVTSPSERLWRHRAHGSEPCGLFLSRNGLDRIGTRNVLWRRKHDRVSGSRIADRGKLDSSGRRAWAFAAPRSMAKDEMKGREREGIPVTTRDCLRTCGDLNLASAIG